MTTATDNKPKEHLVNYREFYQIGAKKYDLSRFKTHKCNNVTDLIKIKAISIYLEKPVLYKQKEFDYKVSLFT